ncbi:TPA: hypothetical protein N0F65_003538 [Lagenidium giganteum]|uniref:Uncharacterized protein n=1 Tax=Lagenidium giganteum TaxID=4803 RepID=A0AAV2YZC0_9STRA|nr:TPA: hypothetical protein N0F65_003538 [Lagenidium giganteum]
MSRRSWRPEERRAIWSSKGSGWGIPEARIPGRARGRFAGTVQMSFTLAMRTIHVRVTTAPGRRLGGAPKWRTPVARAMSSSTRPLVDAKRKNISRISREDAPNSGPLAAPRPLCPAGLHANNAACRRPILEPTPIQQRNANPACPLTRSARDGKIAIADHWPNLRIWRTHWPKRPHSHWPKHISSRFLRHLIGALCKRCDWSKIT